MEKKFGEKLGLLDLTDDEIKRLGECMKDDRFMDLLREYTLAISDPENKKKYEEEIALMEAERGNDVKFIHPCPGHVLKTSRNGEGKCFINICSSPKVGKPVSKPAEQGSTRGMQWSIPHSLSQPREDKDKAGSQCMVYDVVFNPDTYHLAEKNARFRKMIHDMALDAVERLFDVTLDKVNIKKPKMKFKGLPQASIIRTPREDTRKLDAKTDDDPNDSLKFPYPPMQNNVTKNHKEPQTTSKSKPTSKAEDVEESIKKVLEQNDKKPNPSDIKSDLLNLMQCIDGKKEEFVEPKYTLTHRGYFDMKDYYNVTDRERKIHSTRPRELVVNIELPMLKAASALHLEIFEERVFLECAKPVKYKLNLKLPYPVDDSKGHARFDKSKRRLTITLEVLAPTGKHLRLAKAVENEMEDACGSCVPQRNMIKQHGEVGESEEDPSENDLLSSSHPSGLVHGRSACRHQNHGTLWDVKYERDWEKDTDLGFLYKSSSVLVEKLASHICENMQARLFSKDEPRIFYHQDEAFVTIIMNIKLIDPENLWYVLSPNTLQFSATTDWKRVGAPIVYQLLVRFDEKDILDPRRSRVDVSDDNAVFLLRKHISSWHEWQTFEAGMDLEHMKRLSFATEGNINSLITSTKTEAQKSVSRGFDCENVQHGHSSELNALKLLPKEVVDEEKFTPTPSNDNQYSVTELPTLDKILAEVCKIREKDLNVKIQHEELLLKTLNPPGVNIPHTHEEPLADEDDDSEYETADSSSDDDTAEKKVKAMPKTTSQNETGKSGSENVTTQKEKSELQETKKQNGASDSSHNGEKVSEHSSKDMTKGTKEIQDKLKNGSDKVVIKQADDKEPDEVITSHSTKSVIKLSNEMLYEIDYD